MTRNTLLAVAAIALASSSILSAGDVFNGVTPRTATLASDRRTEMQRLQDQVDEMAFLLARHCSRLMTNNRRSPRRKRNSMRCEQNSMRIKSTLTN